jgi:hypothetical protein
MSTPLAQATPSQLAAHYRHRERMERMTPRQAAPAPLIRESLPPVIALPLVEPTVPPPDAVRVPWIDRIDIKRITQAVADHYGITRRDLYSRRRTANIVLPRQVAMYLAKTVTLRSLPEIGRRMGGRDHTTVLHAVRKITTLEARNPDVAANVAAIKASMGIVDA